MKYPSGERISLGDYVWWNERSSTGYVVGIFESASEYVENGMDEPSIWICYDGNKSTSGLFVCYPERAFSSEEIRPVSELEMIEVNKAVLAAKAHMDDDLRDVKFGVFFGRGNKNDFVWKIVSFHGGKSLNCSFVDPVTYSVELIPCANSKINIWI